MADLTEQERETRERLAKENALKVLGYTSKDIERMAKRDQAAEKVKEADLKRRIQDKLVIEKAIAAGITVTEDEVNEAVEQYKAAQALKKIKAVAA